MLWPCGTRSKNTVITTIENRARDLPRLVPLRILISPILNLRLIRNSVLAGISFLACGRLRVCTCLPPVWPSAHHIFPQMVPLAPNCPSGVRRRIREVTRRAKSVSLASTIEELAPYLRGWRSYFGFCETPEVLIGLSRWVRLRLRSAPWRQWKTPRRRRAALLQLGVRPRLASHTAGSGLGPWYLARAKALSVGLSNAYFKSLGLPTLIDGC